MKDIRLNLIYLIVPKELKEEEVFYFRPIKANYISFRLLLDFKYKEIAPLYLRVFIAINKGNNLPYLIPSFYRNNKR